MEQTSVMDFKGGIQKAYVETDMMTLAADPIVQYMTKPDLKKSIENTKKDMLAAAKNMDFLMAAKLRDEPFVFFSPTAGTHAYEKGIAPCTEQGYRPRVVQEAPQWLTVLRLVGAGLGVTIAPACVRQIASPNIVCIPLRDTQARSDIELAYRTGESRGLVAAFAAITRENSLARSRPHNLR